MPLAKDLRNDSRWKLNVRRIVIFLALFLLIDFVISLFLLKGIERFYGLKSNSEVLMIGHSHLMLAVDKTLLESECGLTVAKYTREGVNIADRRVMTEHYFSTCSVKPSVVILGVDPWLFTGEGLSQNSWKLFLPFMDNRAVRSYIEQSATSKFDYYRYRFIRTSRFNATLLNASLRGWLGNWQNLKYGMIDTLQYSDGSAARSFRPISCSSELEQEYSQLLDFLSVEGVKVILLNTPVWRPVIEAQKEGYDRAMFIADSIAGAHCPGATFLDLAPLFSDSTTLFYDPIHMNREGQREVTEYLGEYILGSKK